MFHSRIVILKFRCHSKGSAFQWCWLLQLAFESLNSLTCSLWRGFISAIVVKMLKKISTLLFLSSNFLLLLLFCFWFGFLCIFFRTSHYFVFVFQKLLLTGWIFLKKNCNANIIWELLKFIQPDCWNTALLIGVIHIRKEQTVSCHLRVWDMKDF